MATNPTLARLRALLGEQAANEIGLAPGEPVVPPPPRPRPQIITPAASRSATPIAGKPVTDFTKLGAIRLTPGRLTPDEGRAEARGQIEDRSQATMDAFQAAIEARRQAPQQIRAAEADVAAAEAAVPRLIPGAPTTILDQAAAGEAQAARDRLSALGPVQEPLPPPMSTSPETVASRARPRLVVDADTAYEAARQGQAENLARAEGRSRTPYTKTAWRDAYERAVAGTLNTGTSFIQSAGRAGGGAYDRILNTLGLAGLALGLPTEEMAAQGLPGRSAFDHNLVTDFGNWLEQKVNAEFPGDAPRASDLSAQLASGFGSMVGFIALGVAGKALGAGAAPTTAVVGAGVQGEAGYDEAVRAGADLYQRMFTFIGNAGLGTTEAIPLGRFFDRLGRRVGPARFAQFVRDTAGQGLEETIQEAGTQFGQNVIAAAVYDAERDLGEGVLLNGAIGGILGAGMGAVAGGVGAIRGRRGAGAGQPAPTIQPPPTQGPAPPAGPPPGGEPPEPVSRETPPQAATPAPPAPPPSGAEPVAPPAAADDIAVLLAAGWNPDDIAGMDPAEIADQAEEARALGVEAPPDAAVPEWLSSNRTDAVEIAGRLGLTDTIRQMATEGRTAAEISQALGGRLSPDDVRAVRDNMGIPASGPQQGIAAPPVEGPTPGTRTAPVRVETAEDVDAAGAVANPAPTEAQKEAGNYQKGHVRFQGLDITIETPRDGVRSGVDSDGEPWQARMPAHYGYVKRSEGADGDQVDVYVGPEADSDRVFIVDQYDPKTGKFDEHKAVLGTLSVDDAIDIYRAGFSDGSGRDRGLAITEMSAALFRRWLREGNPKETMEKQAETLGLTTTDLRPAPAAAAPAQPAAEKPILRPTPRRPTGPRGEDILNFLGTKGLAADPELTALGADRYFIPGVGRLVRAGGAQLDYAREAAAQEGYFGYPIEEATARTTVADLLDLIDEALRGKEIRPVDAPPEGRARRFAEARQGPRDLSEEEAADRDAQVRASALVQIEDYMRQNGHPDDPEWAERAADVIVGGQTADIVQALESAAILLANETLPDEAKDDIPTEINEIWEWLAAAPAAATVREGGEQPAQPGEGDAGRGGPGGGGTGVGPVPGGRQDEGSRAGADQGAVQGGEPTLPGFKPVSGAEQAQAGAEKPLRPRAEQQPVGGLFSDDAAQTDLVDAVREKERQDAPRRRDDDAAALPDGGGGSGGQRRPAPAAGQGDAVAPAGDGGAVRDGRPDEGVEPPRAGGLEAAVGAVRDHLRDGGRFETIIHARKMLRDNGFDGTDKAADEAIEEAVVLTARSIVSETIDPKETYRALVDLYGRQPRLSRRTADSMADQAYSTPVPLAYLASQLGYVDIAESAYEPTAGNGALLIEAPTSRNKPGGGEFNISANEMNPARAAALRRQGFSNVTEKDALDIRMNPIFEAVIMNPPFGAVRDGGRTKEWTVDGWTTSNVDHAIAMHALKAMRPDGRAVLIVGGVNAIDKKERTQGYRTKAKREFFWHLYEKYRVVDVFTVSGDLYERQGAGWPVDVIVIEGRGKSDLKLPGVDPPPVFASWDALEEKLDARYGRPAAKPARDVAEQGDRPAGGDADGGGTPGPRGAVGRPAGRPAKPAGVRGPRVRAKPVDEAKPAPAAPGDLPGGGGGRGGPDPGASAGERQPGVGASDADIEAAFDEAMEDVFGPAAPAPERTKAEIAKSAAGNALESADAAMAAIVELFGGGKTVGSGLSFDPETYAKAKPLFMKAAEKFKEFASDVTELVRRMVADLQASFGLTAEALGRLRPYLVQFIKDVRDGAIALVEAEKPGAVRRPARGEPNAAGQVRYVPLSANGNVDTLIPVGMAQATEMALSEVERRHGDIDAFVANELGFTPKRMAESFSAEQVDALALAIDNAKRGEALVIGDQTGIGKGRVVAGMMRWAQRQGVYPIFVTEKPDLYGDMLARDMADIGMKGIDVFVTNFNEPVPLDEEALDWVDENAIAKESNLPRPPRRGSFLSGGTKTANLRRMAEVQAQEKPSTFIFTTYNQTNTQQGKEPERRAFLRAIAPRSMLILDESHNAAGSGVDVEDRGPQHGPQKRSAFIRELVGSSRYVMYSSATWAKRPGIMDLYSRTGMAKAVAKAADLPMLIKRGGVPLQQIVSAQLAKAGQYIRRERSFDGVRYEMDTVPVSADSYSTFTKALNAVFRFDLAVKGERDEIMADLVAEAGGGLVRDSGVGEAAASSTEFAAVMHNIINQMILAIKANGVADLAIDAIKRGEKPVIALANTMESFLNNYAEDNNISFGQPIDVTFRDVLRRYLQRTLRVTVKKPNGDKVHIQVPVSDLSPEMQAAYRRAEAVIDSLDVEGLPVSPIDHIRLRLRQAGYTVAEITGRGTMIDYSAETPTLKPRERREMGAAGKAASKRGFNNGSLDALIINASGSTGISLHASPKNGKDVRQRHMIIAQANPNIDTHMQTLGRIHRTGQVALPIYTQISADIPAEVRPASVLMKKMASLNANTTAARKSVFSAETVDFMNEYGDAVVLQVLSDRSEWNMAMGWPVDLDSTAKEPGDIGRKATGRLPLLDPPEQQALIDAVQEGYKALIARLEAMGENALEAKTVDFKAQLVAAGALLVQKKGDSPFEDSARFERLSVVSQGRAMAPAEVVAAAAEGAGLDPTTVQGDFGAQLAEVVRRGVQAHGQKIQTAMDAFRTFAADEIAALKKDDAKTKAKARHDQNIDRFKTRMGSLVPGARVTIASDGNEMAAVVTAVRRDGETRNPIALSSWVAVFALPSSSRTIVVPFSQLYIQGEAAISEDAFEIRPPMWTDKPAQLAEAFERAKSEGREERIVLTGNILAAYDAAQGRGQIINFTMEDGTVRPGILMRRGFNVETFMASRPVRFQTAEQVLRFINSSNEGEVESTDGMATVRAAGGGDHEIEMPGGRATGGRYFLEPSVRSAVRGGFQKKGSKMRAERVPPDQALAAVAAMMKLGAVFETREQQDLAQQIIDQSPKPPDGGGGGIAVASAPRRWGSVEGRPALAGAERASVVAEVQEIVRTVAGMPVTIHDGPITESNLPPDSQRWNEARGRADTTLIGRYTWRRMALDSLVEVVVSHDAEGAIRTAAHESFHHVWWNLLTDAERGAVVAEMPRLRALLVRSGLREADTIDLQPDYEVVADAFSLHYMRRREGQSAAGLHLVFRRTFERVLALIERIREYLRGRPSARQVFERVASGRINAERLPMVPARSLNVGSNEPAFGSTEPGAFDQTQTPEFKRWFGDSKVVDGKGRPLRVYHATVATFNAFDNKKIGTNLIDAAFGHYFTDNAKYADWYLPPTEEWLSERGGGALQYVEGSQIVPTYVSIKTPKRVRVSDYHNMLKWDRQRVDEYVNDLKEDGYDGIIVKNFQEYGETSNFYIAFEPTQIKSATGNSGAFDPSNPVIVANTPPAAGLNPRRSPLMQRASRLRRRVGTSSDSLREKGQDRMIYWRRLKEQIERESGARLPVSLDVYLAETLYHGRAGERLEDLTAQHWEPLIADMQASGVTLDALDDYLIARHAPERNAEIRLIDPSNDAGSGMTDADAAAHMAALTPEQRQTMERLAARHDAVREWSMSLLVRNGLLGRQEADDWRAKYPNYTPLRGWEAEEQNDDFARVGFGMDVRGPESQRALGRRSRSDSPLAYIFLQAQQAIVRSEKNRVMQALKRLVEAHPNPDLWSIKTGEMRRVIDTRTGLVRNQFVPAGLIRDSNNLFGVKIGGKTQYIEINDKRLVRALRGFGKERHALIVAWFRLARFYAMLQTSLNPEFTLPNWMRDLQTAMVNVLDTEGGAPAGTHTAIVKDAITLKAIRKTWRAIRNPQDQGEYSQWYKEYRLAGGKVSFMNLSDISAIKDRFAKDMERGRIMSMLRGGFRVIEDMNEAVENSTRLTVYIHLRRNGFSQARAAAIAKDLTVNFNRKGDWSPALNSLYLFFNAATQGTFRLAKAVRTSGKVRAAVAAIWALGFGLDWLNWFLAGDDDDDRNYYDAIPDYVKDRNIILMLPWSDSGEYVKIPLAYGYNFPFIAGQRMMAVIRGAKTPGEALGGTLLAGFDAFNPLGSSPSLVQYIAPTMMDPIVQVGFNENWYGGLVQPERYGSRGPASENYFANVSPWARSISEALNSWSGGNSGRSGFIDVSPEVIEHFAEFAGGGAGRTLLNAGKTILGAATGDEILPEDFPLLRRFYDTSTTSTALRLDFYEAWDEVDAARYEVRQLRRDGHIEAARDAAASNARLIAIHGIMRQTKETLSDFRQQRDRVQASGLPAAQRRERIDAINAQERARVMRALQIFEDARRQEQ